MAESKISQAEKEILQRWQNKKIFQKTLEKDSPKGDYIFYDGPPFATGLPHYGHLVASIMKDVVPRYWTMRGYHVDRVWGWDCHGLPIENLIEKELGFKSKKDILEYGVAKFNEACRARVLQFAEEWQKTIPRLGRWADMEHAYKTMDLPYMESVWWVFKELWDAGLVYEGNKSMFICPRCETTLSQQEVTEGYKDIKDWSVTVKFELRDPSTSSGQVPTYLLAWTTTPWTLPGNVALAINKDVAYSLLQVTDLQSSKAEKYIYATDLRDKIFPDIVGIDKPNITIGNPYKSDNKRYELLEQFLGKDLVGKKYKPPFCYYIDKKIENQERFCTVVADDFVTTSEGTGIVHLAAYGEDDMRIIREQHLPFIQHVSFDGHFKDEVTDFKGMSVKPIEDPTATDVAIIKNLAANNLLFAKEKFEHSYPHCWRCDTPLINFATSSWFVNVTNIKTKALKLAEKINWSPEHIKAGRFGKWLAGARDWSISRQRFWASVMPIWKCECGEIQVFGSVAELEKASGKKVTDLHKHIIDDVTVPCPKCGKTVKRIPDVLDTWFDSGSMPYAQLHYPFEHKDKLEKNFPAEFIAEGADQTRAWFYYLHIIGTAIKHKPAYKNVIVNGIVLAEDGKKMSKKLNNYPDPNVVMDSYGADALRYYLLTSPVMEAETLNFSENGVKEALQKNVMLISNVLSFYQMYKKTDVIAVPKPAHVLDKWILAKLQVLTAEITGQMDNYNLVKATRPISGFINELSTWYLRRSRDRFKEGDLVGIATLGYVLQEFSKLIAPFMPFVAEELYLQTGGELESVHLETWPKVQKKFVDEKLISEMDLSRKINEVALSLRAENKIKVRQPLSELFAMGYPKISEEIVALSASEVNVEEVRFVKNFTSENSEYFKIKDNIALNINISEKLRQKGLVREIIRQINQLRKDAGLTITDFVILYQNDLDDIFAQYGEEIKKATLAREVRSETISGMVKIGQGSVGIKNN